MDTEERKTKTDRTVELDERKGKRGSRKEIFCDQQWWLGGRALAS